MKCCVRINGELTDWFCVNTGLKQACLISPQLFNMYINDLVDEIKNLNLGVPVDDVLVAILLYANDIALIVNNMQDLQIMLDKMYEWCQKMET